MWIKKNRLVDIWLANTEKTDTDTLNLLKPLYEKYKTQKYKVAVFESGVGSVFENTRDLLMHNRYKIEPKKRENVR